MTLGLAAAYRMSGQRVRTYKKGADYIDPMWLTAASGRPCRNLDFFTQSKEEIRTSFARHSAAADMCVYFRGR